MSCPALVELACGVVDGVVVAGDWAAGEELAEVAGTVDVDAPSADGVATELDADAALTAGAPDTAGVDVELTNGGALAMYDPVDSTA